MIWLKEISLREENASSHFPKTENNQQLFNIGL